MDEQWKHEAKRLGLEPTLKLKLFWQTAQRQRNNETPSSCPNCQGWGCRKCCSSDAEIRARQGTFG